MAVAASEWLDLIEREYIVDFVTAGGSAVKFLVGDERQVAAVGRRLAELSQARGLEHVRVDAAKTRLHMIQDIFFAIARSLNWNAMAQCFVEALFDRQGYEWPRPGESVPIHEIAESNRIDVTLVRRDFRRWLTAEVMQDAEMTQDFRVAMTRLCLRRLEPEARPGVTMPVLEWLRGELRRFGELKETSITSKITRHNGRAMLRSLCRWLRLCGRRGICITVDIRQLGQTRSIAGGIKYSPAGVMDSFEVLRQVIDDAEHFTGLLFIVLADDSLTDGDPKRCLGVYPAIKQRIWDDVRPEGRDNPLAPLVRLASGPPAEFLETAAVL